MCLNTAPAKKYFSRYPELEDAADEYATANLRWYERHKKRSVFLFRFIGVITIVAGLAIPVVTVAKPNSDLILPCLAFVVAAGTSLSGFFGWHATWQKCTTIQLVLEHAEAIWRVRVTSATDRSEAVRATTEFFDAIKTILTGEAQKWFARQGDSKSPNLSAPES